MRDSLHARLLLVGVVVGLVFTVPLTARATTEAAPGVTVAAALSCTAGTCKGKDPEAYGCAADATTLDEFTDGSFRFEMRHSKKCYAVWTRVSSPKGTPGWYCNTTFAQIRGYTPDDKRKGVYSVQAHCPGTTWTKMWPFTDWVRTCVSWVWFDNPPDECTSRH
jgi:hypothetical protein